MNFQDFRNLQKAYKQVYSSQRLNEFGPGDAGGSLAIKRTFGGAPGTKQNTTVSGSASSGDSNISGSLTSGPISGQGDNTSQGVTNALKNLENPNFKPLDTSTSTITTGVRGTLDANVSGKFGPGQKPPTPVPKPVPTPVPKPVPKPVLTSIQKPVPTAERPLPKPVLTPVPTAERPVPAPVEREAKNMEAIRLAQKPAPATQTRLRGFM